MAARGLWGRGFRLMGSGLLGLALAACGGGGGDGGGDQIAPPGNVDLNAANQTSAARAAAVAVQGGLAITTTGLTGGGPQGIAGVAVLLQSASRKAASALSAPREQPHGLLNVSSLFHCVSGNVSATLDDRDNSLSVTPGDVLGASFVNCRVDAASDEVLDGTMTATYTTAAQSPLDIGATVTVTNLRDASQLSGRSVTLNGGFVLGYVEPTAATSTTRITVPNALSVQVVHPLYQDTVGLQPGYALSLYHDTTTPPGVPSGGGRTMIEVTGQVSSARVGGIFNLWSQPPGLDLVDGDAYPQAGQVLLQGRNGQVMFTVLSTASVRLELDANGDGVYEASQVVPWDSLL
ncbi:MAG: hypothetical protein U1E89_13675 [Burkholderiaceae bacterium]